MNEPTKDITAVDIQNLLHLVRRAEVKGIEEAKALVLLETKLLHVLSQPRAEPAP